MMSIANLFEKIAGRQKQREKARIDDFRGLVRAIAEGKEPDADRVDAVLHDAGKTLDNLRQAVERLQTRMAMNAQLDTMPKQQAEKADLEAKIAKAAEVLSAAEAKFAETVNPFRWRLDTIKNELHQTWSLTQALVESCPYPELVERARQIDQPRSETHDEATRLRNEIEEHVNAISTYKAQAEQSTYRPHQVEYLDRARYRKTLLAETQAKLKETLKRADDLEKLEARIREQMLVP